MNSKLFENNYLIIPNFISPERSKILSDEFKLYCEKENLSGDDQSPNSHSIYNHISFLELLCEKTPEVSTLIEETVLPTYSYARVYKEGSVLESHVDRDACEISLTLHLDGDYPWPIWIETPQQEKRFVSLNPGDAIVLIHGAHAIRVIEDMQCISVKQGPFLGDAFDKIIIKTK
jgi:hypothetical protein